MSGRKPKPRIDYAGWDTDIFENDEKIDALIDCQGWIGFCIYFYLCQKAYASDGFYYRWSYANAPTTARRMGGGVSSGTVTSTVGTCARVGLFDKRLLDEHGILTSRGIQRRFVAAIQKRSYRTVDKRFWLLNEAETAAGKITFLKESFPGVGDSYSQNADFLPENTHYLPENDTNSKVKVNISLSGLADASADAKKKAVVFDHDSKAYKSAIWLDAQIAQRSPHYRRKTEAQLQKWAYTFDLMNRRDEIEWESIRDTLVWSQQDGFWRDNILSPEKFRKQFPQLELKRMKEEQQYE